MLIPFKTTPSEQQLSGPDRDEADTKLMEARKDAKRGWLLHEHPIVADEFNHIIFGRCSGIDKVEEFAVQRGGVVRNTE